MKLIDTNIFIYAVGRDHPLKSACRSLLASVAETPSRFALNAEVLQELLYVYASRGERSRGLQVVEDAQQLCGTVLSISVEDVDTAVSFMKRYSHLSPRDAIHAAVVFNHRLEAIVSTDADFDPVVEISRVPP